MPLIVIAEDEDDVREFLTRAFARYAPHAEVIACVDGASALEAIHARGCDLLVSDHRMPNMTGVELLRTLRVSGSDMSVIIISADATAQAAAVEAGATAFFYKPLTTGQIRSIIATWLAPEAGSDPRPTH
jgi:DNA-binding NtrC family response regulator